MKVASVQVEQAKARVRVMSVCLYVCPFVRLFDGMPLWLSACPSVGPSGCLRVWLSACLFACLSACVPACLSFLTCKTENLQRHKVVKVCITAGAVIDSGGRCRVKLSNLPGEPLENIPINVIQDLVDKKVLKSFDIAAGQVLWALDLNFIRLGLQFLALDPTIDSACDRGCTALADLCKSELVLKLLKLGWVKAAGKPEPHKDGGPIHVWSVRLWGSRWYLIALLSSRQIFRKGLRAIEHDRPEAYFKCCYFLTDTSKLRALDSKGRQKQDVYLKVLADKLSPDEIAALDAPVAVAALGDGGPVDAALEAIGDAADMPLVALPAPEVAEVDEMWHDLCKPQEATDSVGRHISIRLDGFSHTSHRQRAYLDCEVCHTDGLQCHKYKFLHNFTSRAHCCAWIMAWHDMGTVSQTREQHYECVPHPADVERNVALFQGD